MPSALPQHLLGQERVGPQRSIRIDVFAINRVALCRVRRADSRSDLIARRVLRRCLYRKDRFRSPFWVQTVWQLAVSIVPVGAIMLTGLAGSPADRSAGMRRWWRSSHTQGLTGAATSSLRTGAGDRIDRTRGFRARGAPRARRPPLDLVGRPRSLIIGLDSRAGARAPRERGSVGAFTRLPTRSRPRSASRH
jgi:hypothetical protein